MKNLTASDRSALIRLASSLPKGDENRRTILAGLADAKTASLAFPWGVAEPKPGKAYSTAIGISPGSRSSGGYRTSVFLGYKVSGNTLSMKWRDVPQDAEPLLKDGEEGAAIGQLRGAQFNRDTNNFELTPMEWEAHLYKGLFYVHDSSVGATGFLRVF